MSLKSASAALSLFSIATAAGATAVLFPAAADLQPGPAHAALEADGTGLVLRNGILEAAWTLQGPAGAQWLRPGPLRESLEGSSFLSQDVFCAKLAGARVLKSSSMVALGHVNLTKLLPDPTSATAALGFGGWRAEVRLRDEVDEIHATWAVELRDGANYVRQFVTVLAQNRPVILEELVLLDVSVGKSSTSGSLAGAVSTAGRLFLGVEHPQAMNGDGSLPEDDGGEVLLRFSAGDRHGDMDVDVDVSSLVEPELPLHVYMDNWHNDHVVHIQRVDLLLAAGKTSVITSDTHKGTASRGNTRGNIFALVPPKALAQGRYVARFSLRVDGDYSGEWVFGAHRKGRPDRVRCSLRRNRTLQRGERQEASLVVGVHPRGQLRRAFLHYLERERPHRARQVLHYNSWYDIGTGGQYDADTAKVTLEKMHAQLYTQGLQLDAFLLDDGWDDPDSGPWEPHAGFAGGKLSAFQDRARQLGVSLGVWFSPWGGYHEPRQRRLAAARKAGLPIREEPVPRTAAVNHGKGVCTKESPCSVGEGDCESDADCAGSLACFQTDRGVSPPGVDASAVEDTTVDFCFDPSAHSAFFGLGEETYYEFFLSVIQRWVAAGAVLLKLDGLGDPAGNKYARAEDFDGGIALLRDLRKFNSEVFINLSTGTWASPFWLLSADTIWRRGHDHYFQGEGVARERWITYRDAMVFEHVVQKSPLFPLTSLMVHGIIFAKDAWDLKEPEGAGGGKSGAPFRHEVRSAFGSGTMLQELYLTPSLLSFENWEDIAQAARWARGAVTTLADVHWVGGNPSLGQPYGWAAWRDADAEGKAARALLTLRNPSSKAQTLSLDAAVVFELPDHALGTQELHTPFSDQRTNRIRLPAGRTSVVDLEPFEVLVFDSAAPPREGFGEYWWEVPSSTFWGGVALTVVLALGVPILLRRQSSPAQRDAGTAPVSMEELRRRRLAALEQRVGTDQGGAPQKGKG